MRAKGKRIAMMFFIAVGVLTMPIFSHAAFGEANAQCICDFNPKTPPPLCPTVPCTDTTSGIKTTGFCSAPLKCEAKQAQTMGGDMKGIMDALKLITELFKKQPSSGGSQPPPSQQAQNQYPSCVYNAATQTFSPIPCMNPDGSVNYGITTGIDPLTGLPLGGLNIADQLLDALGGSVSEDLAETEPTKIGDQLVEIPGEEPSSGEDAQASGSVQEVDPKTLESSLFGDIYVGGADATIFARARDPASNTEVAGFFGGASAGPGGALGLVGKMCSSRPWAGSFLSKVIPATFFDGLCQRAGYQVGQVVMTPSGVIPSAPRASIQKAPEQAPPRPTNPEADVWAEPASVRLGTRTYIFWTSNETTACTVTGPSFEQSALSGGASTVPLSDASTFKIVCQTASGETVDDSVTVRLTL